MNYNIMAINPGHNGSVALISNGDLVYYTEEERLTRVKYDGNPFKAMMFVMSNWKVDELVIGGTTENLPTLPWTQEDPNSALVRKFNPGVKVTNLGAEHHLGHVACSFYNSGFEKCLSIVIDGAGSYKKEMLNDSGTYVEGFEAESIWVCEYPSKFQLFKKIYGSNKIEKCSSDNGVLEFDDAVTITKAYEAVTQYLGFGFIEAGKTMGLASYGKKNSDVPPLFFNDRGNKNVFKPFYPAGAFIDVERNLTLKQKIPPREWHRDPSKLSDIEKDIAWQIQNDSQEQILKLIKNAVKVTGIQNVCISGGYGLNCVANYFIKKALPNINLYCEPISHDGGTAIGLAKLAWYTKTQETKIRPQKSIYYGFEYPVQYVDNVLNQFKESIFVENVTYEKVAELIAEKNIIAMYQGGAEAGPRALGNRSILYDPTDPNGKNIVNVVKGREWFRPFAGSVLKERAGEYFDMAGLEESPFMMYAVNVLPEKTEKIPAITHIDNTCRIQTVTYDQNKHYYELIKAFDKITGVPVLFNTSFNLAGDPLVETIEDALNTLFRSKLNFLYLPEYSILVKKKTML